MNPQQLAMQARVLNGENEFLKKKIKAMESQQAQTDTFERLLVSALSGYCSQPRAAANPYWDKDSGTGTLVPRDGGPEWAAAAAIEAMNATLEKMQSMIAAAEKAVEEVDEAQNGEVGLEVHPASEGEGAGAADSEIPSESGQNIWNGTPVDTTAALTPEVIDQAVSNVSGNAEN